MSEKNAVRLIWSIGIIFGILGIVTAIILPSITGNASLSHFFQIKEMFYYFFPLN
jgi:UDP-N-acetylglucosamine--dolichyl-phosphate N-acetylglucosaminephosphotransferase